MNFPIFFNCNLHFTESNFHIFLSTRCQLPLMRHDEWLLQLIIPFAEAFNSLGWNDAIQLWVSLVLRQWIRWDEDPTKESQMWLLCAQSDKDAFVCCCLCSKCKNLRSCTRVKANVRQMTSMNCMRFVNFPTTLSELLISFCAANPKSQAGKLRRNYSSLKFLFIKRWRLSRWFNLALSVTLLLPMLRQSSAALSLPYNNKNFD